MSPLFSGLDSLVGLARHGVDVKPTLLRVLTDLYVQRPSHTADEERQYIELSLRLIDTVDAATRDLVARKLGAYPAAPRAVVDRLAVRQRRPAATPQAQPAAPLPDATVDTIDARRVTDRFFAADAGARRDALQILDTNEPLPDADMDWLTPGEDVSRRLEASALAGRPGDFVRGLERALGVSRIIAERIVNDPGGEPLVVAARALAVPVDTLQRILLLLNPAIGHSVRRVYALTDLFNEISVAAALRMVACWRESGAAPAAPGRPAYRPATRPRLASTVADQARTAAPRLRPEAGSTNEPIEKVAS